jgi:anti-anti-sigma factor
VWQEHSVSILEIAVAAGDAGPVVKLSGECDITVAGQLREALQAQITRGARQVTVDLSQLRFADSASVHVLLDAHQALTDTNGFLQLAFPQPAVAMVLGLLGVDQVLTVRTRAGAADGSSEDVSLYATIRTV